MGYHAAGKGECMARKNVVYLLGAGFSAPLDLPTMSDFFRKSKEMLHALAGNLKDIFHEVFDLMRDVDHARRDIKLAPYYIEELLSVIEMENVAKPGGPDRTELLKDYIRAVIRHYSPKIHNPFPTSKFPDGFWSHLFGDSRDRVGDRLNNYGVFLQRMVGLSYVAPSTPHFPARAVQYDLADRQDVEYAIVTLNYDLVLEDLLRHIDAMFQPIAPGPTAAGGLRIAKLHGSVAEGSDIMPPTPLKGAVEDVRGEWEKAFGYLCEANCIRIIGYSLPESDPHIRYLLAAAAMNSHELLEAIDVINTDETRTFQIRMERTFTDDRLNVRYADASQYINGFSAAPTQVASLPDGKRRITLTDLEERHDNFMATTPGPPRPI